MTRQEILAVRRLRRAIDTMAGRYGITCMDLVDAPVGTPEYFKAHRAAARQYRGLLRLTTALERVATGRR